MSPWETAIVGFGAVAHAMAADQKMAARFEFPTHASVLQQHPDFDLASVADSHEDRRRAASSLGVPHVVASAAELPDSTEVVVLATPASGRAKALEELPESVRAVVMEKPLAANLAEAKQCVQTIEERGIIAEVNFWRRWDEGHASMAARIALDMGPLQAGLGLYCNGLENNASHLIDYAGLLFGPVARVVAHPSTSPDEPGFDLIHQGGERIHMRPVSHYREVGLDLWGLNGRATILNEGLTLQWRPRAEHRAMDAEHEITDVAEQLEATAGTAFYQLYSHMAARLRGEAAPASPPSNALHVMQTLEAVRASSTDFLPRDVP